jgi:NOL1/NOP2/sun family putative RNA methylase
MANDGKEYFLNRYRLLGGDAKAVTLKPTIRVNTLKTTAKQIITRLEKLGVKLERAPFTKNGYYVVSSPFSLGAITENLLGYYYLQEAAAQLPVEVLDPKAGETILDMCAAPGGKTTQMAAHMDNKGTIISFELKPHRLTSLTVNLERMGVQNCTVFNEDVTKAKKLGLTFDKILLDAPCAGNYLSEPDWFNKRTPQGIERSAQIQQKLIKTAVELLNPGGTLIYSTCSLEPEENEINMHWAIHTLPVRLEKVNLSIGDPGITNVFGTQLHKDVALCKRLWPHKTGTEGFFIAKLVKQ